MLKPADKQERNETAMNATIEDEGIACLQWSRTVEHDDYQGDFTLEVKVQLRNTAAVPEAVLRAECPPALVEQLLGK